MNKELLSNAIGNIDDDLLKNYEKSAAKRKKAYKTAASLAACLCVVLLGTFVASSTGLISLPTRQNEQYTSQMDNENGETPNLANDSAGDDFIDDGRNADDSNSVTAAQSNTFPVIVDSIPPNDSVITDEIAPILLWEQRGIADKFAYLTFESRNYTTRNFATKEGDFLAKTTLTATDPITDKPYTMKAEIYSITGISKECAVAVRFENDSTFYAYVNANYRPKNLEQLVIDLNLRGNLQFGSVWYSGTNSSGTYESIQYTGLASETVWSMLLNDLSVKNIDNYDSKTFISAYSISIDIPLLGYKNIALSVTEDGYLTTNILDAGKAFFIGADKVAAFCEFVKNNCKANVISSNGSTSSSPGVPEEQRSEPGYNPNEIAPDSPNYAPGFRGDAE